MSSVRPIGMQMKLTHPAIGDDNVRTKGRSDIKKIALHRTLL